jgi:hypothetical protein
MKLWITKYALTSGVVVVDGKVSGNVATVDTGYLQVCYHGNDWHNNERSAEEQFTAMIEAKRKSLKKALAKLDALEDAGDGR